MKKIVLLLFMTLIISVTIIGCTPDTEEIIDGVDEDIIDQPVDENNNDKPNDDRITSSGTFVGFADNNSFEVIDDQNGYIVFYKNGAYEDYSSLNLNAGDRIKTIYKREKEQNHVEKVEVLSQVDQEINLVTKNVNYVGLIDRNSFEVISDDENIALRYLSAEDKIESLDIDSNDLIEVTWYENEEGQLIVLWIEFD
ncbi:hypothetical protein GC105_07845 [Alkalibaculum sp. M08DMB]|uniref:DUF3221 domain-containing protein n=1 Tax=Alkalibaculum sporogenes TaxID=2655001 RepID=A0A6A7K8Q6_9FIRM|nr:hypothetical protein [Alkalibaculum sporogenes]MPW25701.1 hypothetical protein [Alkalibaculum sporogenes]